VDPRTLKIPFCGTRFSLGEAVSYGEQHILACFSGVKVTFVNNVADIAMPFASFNLSNLHASVLGFSHSQRVAASLDLSGDYFNQVTTRAPRFIIFFETLFFRRDSEWLYVMGLTT
jgi:hypothetical protein